MKQLELPSGSILLSKKLAALTTYPTSSIVCVPGYTAWLGIFLLVGWEFYLNSPLFDRAAPMAPVLYEILM